MSIQTNPVSGSTSVPTAAGIANPAVPVNPASTHAAPAAPTVMPQVAAKAPAPLERVRQVAADMEKFVRDSRRNVQFEVDDAAGVVVVRVIDATSGDVIRQIPNEEFLRLARRVSENTPSVNLLVDDAV